MAGLAAYRDRWVSWVRDAMLETHGITFERTPAGPIVAPVGMVRVCAWHMDFDERPTCYQDVASADEARTICAELPETCGWNVDFATAHDDTGAVLVAPPY